MRTLIGIYRRLGDYLDAVDAEAQARGEGPIDKSIDTDFRSGVYLGCGVNHLVLSMMPGKLETLLEIFGYRGDRHLGLDLLYRAGGWVKGMSHPRVGIGTFILVIRGIR